MELSLAPATSRPQLRQSLCSPRLHETYEHSSHIPCCPIALSGHHGCLWNTHDADMAAL